MDALQEGKKTVTLLYVEDEREPREIVGEAIATEYPDITVHTAANGAEGLELFKAHRPEVVLTDILMPEMDGLRMAAEIAAIDPETELIALTAYSDTNFLLSAIETGFSHYVLKPIDYDRLFPAIEKSLRTVELKRRVQEQNEEIRQFAAVLEKRVEERTRELEESRQALEKRNKKLAEITGRLKGARDRYWSLYNWSPLGYMSLGDDFTIREINITGAHMLGARRAELRGTPIGKYLSADSVALLKAACEECTHATPSQAELEIRLNGNRFVYVHLHCLPYKEEKEGRNLFRTAFVDISMLKEAEEKLRTSERLLLEQGRMAAMGEMLVNLSHHWRQPLNSIAVHLQELELLSETGEVTDEVLGLKVEAAMTVLQQMSKTIDDFSEFTSSDSEPVLFTLEESLEKAVLLVSETFRFQGIRIEKGKIAPLRYEGYPHEYTQVLLNLLVNARDAIVARKQTDGRIEVNIWEEEGKKVLTVADNAGGIEEAIIESIFDPFFTTKKQGEGFGLGLYMAKMVI
ncbi:response regulator [Geomonas sp. RF6]|uniref:response regulator n=1 Tax=Geomonas sp. RF6 TaxID=2897342 RepID=UPI001E517EAF|nr:response regulator [Geomonas sp. RF6]UFS69981.1 response regulator [Geomonas sp. RF6]